jgi:bifunctional UDP-N-acetylglucosamine pyrophosphorylase/glucosamine-1-phosphate N-acetyltransferase
VAAAAAPHPTVVQTERLGTADAVRMAQAALADFRTRTVLILFGDTPLITADTLRRMLDARAAGASVVVLGFRPDDPSGYGRLQLDRAGALAAIVEDRDATEEQRAVSLCNGGVMAVDAAKLFALIERVGKNNAKGEYYLTDIISLAKADGLSCTVVEADADEVMGVDGRAALARAEAAWQKARRQRAMAEGATLLDPDSVWFSFDTALGRDVTVGPNVFFGPGVTVADNAKILSFSHLDGVTVHEGAIVGPFARLRPGAVIGRDAHVGNFVEIKNAVLGEGARPII